MDTVTNPDSVTSSAKRRDAISPTPWRVEKSPANSNFWVVRCDNGVSVATAWREADAAFIVEAVNAIDATLKLKRTLLGWSMERDRLRDIVRKLANEFEQMEERDTVCNTDRVKRMYALFREAIGEESNEA